MSSPRRHRVVLSLVAIAAALAACGGRPAVDPAPAPAAPPSPLARLDGRLDLEGRPLTVTGQPDVDATVVVFFATWCHPCRHELALLGELRPRFRRIKVVGLNAYEEWGQLSDQQRMRAFLAEHAPWLEVVPEADDLLDDFGGVPRIPTLLVYDRRGAVVAEFRRDVRPPPSYGELEAALAAAVAR
jgi:thiol-disulfide isomerase/thioredoxin